MSNTKDQTPETFKIAFKIRVMNSHKDNSVHTAESPDTVFKKSIYACIFIYSISLTGAAGRQILSPRLFITQ